MLAYKDAQRLLSKYGIKTAKTFSLENIKFPVALKVDSPHVIHKSDLGLVFTNISSNTELKLNMNKADKILLKNKVYNYDFIIQEMVKGQEIIIGMKRDKIFGPAILFGLGGVFVELLKDVSMRIAPLSKKDCIHMINEIKGKKILDGYRNFPKVNHNKIIDLLLKTSKLAIKETCISELDFNPVIINEKHTIVVDARIIKNA